MAPLTGIALHANENNHSFFRVLWCAVSQYLRSCCDCCVVKFCASAHMITLFQPNYCTTGLGSCITGGSYNWEYAVKFLYPSEQECYVVLTMWHLSL